MKLIFNTLGILSLICVFGLISCEERDMSQVGKKYESRILRNHKNLQESVKTLQADINNEAAIDPALIDLSDGICSDLNCLKRIVTYYFKHGARTPFSIHYGGFNLKEITAVQTKFMPAKGVDIVVREGMLYGMNGEMKKGSIVEGRIIPLGSDKIDSIKTEIFLEY